MKRIQAQRKFAQGAPIPSSNFSNSDRRLDVTSSKEESRNIVHNNTPVKTFLDFISFNQIHEHRVPVVVLERLRTNPSNPFIINQKIEELEGSVEAKLPANINLNTDAMCLRSHIRVENISEEDITDSLDELDISKKNIMVKVPETTIKLKNLPLIEPKKAVENINRLVSTSKSVHKNTTNNIIKRLACTSTSDASVDDDTPLAHYAVNKSDSKKNKNSLSVKKTKRLTIIKNSPLRKQVCKSRKKISEDNSNDNMDDGDGSGNTTRTNSFPEVLHENQTESNLSSITSEVLNQKIHKEAQEKDLKIKQRIKPKRNLKKLKGRNLGFKKMLKNPGLKGMYNKPGFRKMRKGKNKKANPSPKYKKGLLKRNVCLKNIQSAISSPNRLTPAPSSSQITSSYLLENCIISDVIDLTSETDDIDISSLCLKCEEIENIMQLDQPSSNSGKFTCGKELSCCAPKTVSLMNEISLDFSIQQSRLQLAYFIAYKNLTSSRQVLTCHLVPTLNFESLNSNNPEDFTLVAGDAQSSSPNLVSSNSSEEKVQIIETQIFSSTQTESSEHALNYEQQENETFYSRHSSNSKQPSNYQHKENETSSTFSSTQSSSSNPPSKCKRRENEICTRSLTQSSVSKRVSSYNRRENETLCKRSLTKSSNLILASNYEKLCTLSSSQLSGSKRPSNYEQRGNEKLSTRSSQSPGSMRLSQENEIPNLRPPSNLEELVKQEPSTDSRQSSNAITQPLVAPVYTPTVEEFSDPIAYFDSIMPTAEKYGICKVVPPADFQPTYHVDEEMTFNVTNQYIGRLFHRWGPGAKEMCTIKAHLASQSVFFKRAPLYEGMEVNLPKLYQLVQRHGGLKKVIERKRWTRVAEEMRFKRDRNPEKKLDQLYVKYLLPYDTLSTEERDEIMSNVERVWDKKYRKMMERASDPFHRQNKLLSGCDSSEEEEDDEYSDDDKYIIRALAEAEECVVPGRKMNLATFAKIAVTASDTFFNPPTRPKPAEVEEVYWRLVLNRTEHVCIYSASIDTGTAGYGFTKNMDEKYADHPWNLKMLANNKANILRHLGEVLGVTVPTLHLGMVFSSSCWHRDPHSLPWTEFIHSGFPKIWYGIPDGQSRQFRQAVESLCPTSCQNKSIWLPSDIAMIPPELLLKHGVTLSRVEQGPGEYIIVFPKAYSCSISTGFAISESVYFASMSWLEDGLKCFHEAQMSCEPTMISVESLLLAMMSDGETPLAVLRPALATLSRLLHIELSNRRIIKAELAKYPKTIKYMTHEPGTWNVREQDECEVCRKTLFVSRIRGLTKNNTSLCLEHANMIIQEKASKNLRVPYFEVEFFFTVEEIDNLLSSASKRIHDLEALELAYI